MRPLSLFGLAPIFALSACSLIESATSTKVVSGLVVASPEIRYAGLYNVESEVIATSWVGERESGTSTKEPTPISGAVVSVSVGGTKISLPEVSGQKGVYLKTSLDEARLTYNPSATYVFDAIINDTFGGQGDAPPKLSDSSLTFTPQLGQHPTIPTLKSHQKNTALNVAWGQQSGRYAYVTVFRGDKANPDHPQQVFDTRPKTAQEILDFVVGEPPTSVDIPASVFDRDGLYAVLIVAANKGGPRSNTFFGSPYLIGSGAVGLFGIGDIGL